MASYDNVNTDNQTEEPRWLKELSKNLFDTSRFFLFFLVVGLIVVWSRVGLSADAMTPILWALSCLASGAACGFLFGIPKILQGTATGGVPPAPPAPPDAGGSPPPADSTPTPPPAPSSSYGYSQRVNTNLEEISDWLTKIIVGLGLVNLAKIPPRLDQMASFLAREMNPPGQKAFASALIVYFSIIGFLYGYLFTRLFLQRVFAMADLSVTKTADEMLSQAVNAASRNVLASNPDAGKAPSDEQAEAAERVAQVAMQSGISVVRKQLADLAREYERIRASMLPGDPRTRRMEVTVTKMRTLALAARPLLPELINSPSSGLRLAAVVILQVHIDPVYLSWLADRVSEERPFIGYHATVALLGAVRTLGSSHHEQLNNAIRAAKAALGPNPSDTDRLRILEQAEQELASQSQTVSPQSSAPQQTGTS